jgi:hypothetical protein
MNAEELSREFILETNRVICLIERDFMHLTENQLHYQAHINHGNIGQIMLELTTANEKLLSMIDQALPSIKFSVTLPEYRRNFIAKYILARVDFRYEFQNYQKPMYIRETDILFEKIIHQQQKIKEFALLCLQVDLNQRAIPFPLFRMIRLSLAETLDYLILRQKAALIKSRNILMWL